VTDYRDKEIQTMLSRAPVADDPPGFFDRLRERAEAEPSGRASLGWRASMRGTTGALLAAFGALCAGAGCAIGVTAALATSGGSHANVPTVPHSTVPRSPVLSFAPAAGWNTVQASSAPPLPQGDEAAWAANVPIIPADSVSGWPRNTAKSLPKDGIVVSADSAQAVDDVSIYPDRTLPLKLSDGTFHANGYETQPAPNVSAYLLYAHIGSSYVLVQVWIGANHPSPRAVHEAQAELDRLQVPK
jgi:hypothetical protein